MVVNRGIDGGGQFVDQRGQFLLAVCPGDTIAFGAIGFHTRERVAPVQGKQWEWEVRLHRLSVEVGTAEVVAPRELREILRDIETLGYNEEDFRLTSVDALSSPITFLYQMLPGLIFFNPVDIDNRNHPIVRAWNETVQNVAE